MNSAANAYEMCRDTYFITNASTDCNSLDAKVNPRKHSATRLPVCRLDGLNALGICDPTELKHARQSSVPGQRKSTSRRVHEAQLNELGSACERNS